MAAENSIDTRTIAQPYDAPARKLDDELSLERLAEQVPAAIAQILERTYDWQFLFDGSLWERPGDEEEVRT